MSAWEDLPPGRELDRVVAEKLHWHNFFEKNEWFEDPWAGSYEKTVLYGYPVGIEYPMVVPEYSTNLSKAWDLKHGHSTSDAVPFHPIWLTMRADALAYEIVYKWLEWMEKP